MTSGWYPVMKSLFSSFITILNVRITWVLKTHFPPIGGKYKFVVFTFVKNIQYIGGPMWLKTRFHYKMQFKCYYHRYEYFPRYCLKLTTNVNCRQYQTALFWLYWIDSDKSKRRKRSTSLTLNHVIYWLIIKKPSFYVH